MLLTISTTHRPATDLVHLLHHDLDGVGVAALPFGRAMVCYSQADEARCTAAVLLDAPRPGPSQLGVALAQVFGRTLDGRDDARPDLAGRTLPFEVTLPVLPSRGGAAMVRALFEPLGYRVTIHPVPLDPRWPHEHEPSEMAVHLAARMRIADLLSHLCLLLPVLDEDHRRPRGVAGSEPDRGDPTRKQRAFVHRAPRCWDGVTAGADQPRVAFPPVAHRGVVRALARGGRPPHPRHRPWLR